MIREKCLSRRDVLNLSRKIKKTIGFKALSFKINEKYYTLKARCNGYLKLPEDLAKKIEQIIEESRESKRHEKS